MNALRLKQIEEIYHAALEIAPAMRESFFSEYCGADEDLRREVESLLSFENAPDNFLDTPPESFVAEMFSEQNSHTNLIGKEIGHYKIQKLLGKGGMGEVYLAEDLRLHRKVALKLLPASFANDKARLGRFEQEARAASGLNHPNILTVYEFGLENGVHFLATELVEGETLREKLRGSEMSLTDALDIAAQTVFALSAAHAAGILHRDLKPENIMIRADGIVKVLDFGLAKLTGMSADSVDKEGETLVKMTTQTKPGMLMGTLAYMSPEQVRGQKLDARSDIFSLGIVIYEMFAGKEPFDKPTSSDVIAAILTENPPPLSQVRPDAPAELERIVGKALRKNKDERYQTTKDLLNDVKSLRREMEFSSNPQRTTAGDMTRRTEAEDIQVTNETVRSKFSFAPAAVIFLAASLAIGAIWWFAGKIGNQIDAPQPAILNTVEVVNWRNAPGEIYSVGSFSPDGKMIAFTSTKTGTKNIWVKQISGGEAVQITKDEFSNQNPIWSPNGDEIAFYSTRSGTPGIWRMSSFGGNPTFVKTIKDGGMILKYWSKRDVIYYEASGNLFALDIKSGQSAQLTNFDAEKIVADSISISPDEEHIGYITFENEQYVVWEMPVRGGSSKQLVSLSSEVKNTVWHSDGKRLLYSQMVDGTFQIFAASIDSGKQTQITFGDKDGLALDVSRDGTKILYGSSKEESDVWGVNVEKREEFPFASDINAELWANVSPDGKTVAFQSIKNLSQGDKIFNGAILTKPVDSDAPPFQLVAEGFLPVWSPGGGQLAFMRQSGEVFNLWTIKAAGGEEKQLTSGDGIPSIEFSVLPYNLTQTSNFSWSPNGKKIAYISDRSGQRNIWLVDADNAGNTQLTNNADSNLHVYCPLWSSDGKRVAFSAKPNNPSADGKIFYATFVIDAETKNAKAVVQAETFQRLLGWSPLDKEIILAATNKNPTGLPMEVNIIGVKTETGEQRQITKLESAYLYNIYLSADKKILAYTSNKDGKDNVWTMRLNGGEARKITSNNDARLYFSSLSWSPDNRFIYFGKQLRYSLLSMVTNYK